MKIDGYRHSLDDQICTVQLFRFVGAMNNTEWIVSSVVMIDVSPLAFAETELCGNDGILAQGAWIGALKRNASEVKLSESQIDSNHGIVGRTVTISAETFEIQTLCDGTPWTLFHTLHE